MLSISAFFSHSTCPNVLNITLLSGYPSTNIEHVDDISHFTVCALFRGGMMKEIVCNCGIDAQLQYDQLSLQ